MRYPSTVLSAYFGHYSIPAQPSRAEILQGRHHSEGLGNNRRKRNGRLRGNVKGLKGRYGEAESLGEVSSVTNHRDIHEFARKLDNISDPTQRRQMIMEQKKKMLLSNRRD